MTEISGSLEYYRDGENVVAIVIRREVQGKLSESKVFTPPDWKMQVGFSIHRSGHTVKPHVHSPAQPVKWDARFEVLHVLKGKVRIHLYGKSGRRLGCTILEPGDTIVMWCGHRVDFLEDSILLEVKEGPYPGPDLDKIWISVEKDQ